MASQDQQSQAQKPTATPQPSSDPATEPAPSSSPSSSTTTAPSSTTNPRLLALQSKHSTLLTTLTDLKQQRSNLASRTTLPSGLLIPSQPSDEETLQLALKASNAVIKEHIALLHRYNEIKDIGQGLMGLVAERRGCRIRDVMGEFGVGEGD